MNIDVKLQMMLLVQIPSEYWIYEAAVLARNFRDVTAIDLDSKTCFQS